MSNSDIINQLRFHGLSLGCVESLTGGAFASSVVDISFVSSVFRGGIVTYSPLLKISLAHVLPETIEKFGVVSSRCAMEMAAGGQKKLGVDVCISFTGNAGPSVQENTAVGDVYIAIAYRDQHIVEFYQFHGDRQKIRRQSVEKGWELIDRVLKNIKSDYL